MIMYEIHKLKRVNPVYVIREEEKNKIKKKIPLQSWHGFLYISENIQITSPPPLCSFII